MGADDEERVGAGGVRVRRLGVRGRRVERPATELLAARVVVRDRRLRDELRLVCGGAGLQRRAVRGLCLRVDRLRLVRGRRDGVLRLYAERRADALLDDQRHRVLRADLHDGRLLRRARVDLGALAMRRARRRTTGVRAALTAAS